MCLPSCNWMMTNRWWHGSSRYSYSRYQLFVWYRQVWVTPLLEYHWYLQANPYRNSHGVVHKYYSFTDKVTAYAAVLLLAYHRRKAYIYRGTGRGNWYQRLPKMWECYEEKSAKIRLLLYTCRQSPQRNHWQMNCMGERSINYLASRQRIRFLYWQ